MESGTNNIEVSIPQQRKPGKWLISYKLYIRGYGKDNYVYKSNSRPVAVYWSKDDNLFVNSGNELRLVY